MNSFTAIIGDVHGNLSALEGLLQSIEGRWQNLVFVGDYINRGQDSASVLDKLAELSTTDSSIHFIAGNHDAAFLTCLTEGSLPAFLRIGGAATIRSYIERPEPDVMKQLQQIVPQSHLDFLRSLRSHYKQGDLLVTHGPNMGLINERAFHVFGHLPQSALVPTITAHSAAIDTGCGTLPSGRLTCLIWPTLEFVQVDGAGIRI